MSMKYIVVKRIDESDQLFIFPPEIDHIAFYSLLRNMWPDVLLVSAGVLTNHHESYKTYGDSVRMHGESKTLDVKCRFPEDIELFISQSEAA